MKNLNETVSISLPEELGEEIECKVEFHIENNGIGSYEYWGFKGYDAGQDYLETDSIKPIYTDQTEEIKASINKYIDDNYDSVCEDTELAIDEIYKNRLEDI